MACYRSAVAKQAIEWLGRNEKDGSHKEIIDIYNSYLPLPRGHKMSYTEPWCAATISAIAIKLGYTDIIPIECSCSKMIEIAKSKNIWVENDAYVPDIGDFIIYDWGDNGKGDNKGAPDHIGVVVEVTTGRFTVVEGNKDNSVANRVINVDGRFIRGFITPKYDDVNENTPTTDVGTAISQVKYTVTKGDTLTSIAKKYSTTVDQIVKNNNIANPNKIIVGQVLTITSETKTVTEDNNASKPKYNVGDVYTLQVELKVRTNAGTNYKSKTYSQLTSDGKKHDNDKDGALDKGTRVTCLSVKNVGEDIWIKCPSGWIAAFYNGNIYVK